MHPHGLAFLRRTAVANERQEYQRILQAFGLVDGDYLDQFGITFQPQHLIFTGALASLLDQLAQAANQCLFTVQLACCALQQLGQMQ